MRRQTPVSLLNEADRSHRYFGAAARMDQLTDEPELRELMIANCGSLTPEIHLKWNSLEWKRGEFNYAPVDELVRFGRRHDIAVRGHTLIWERSTPEWAKHDMLAKRDWKLVQGHFARTLGRYGRDIDEWDVVNEPIDTETGADGLRRTTFHQAFGDTYIQRALEEARTHAPRARLLINEYGFDYANPVDTARRAAFLDLLTRLTRRGAPIDGVGLQAHLDVSKGPIAASELRIFLRRIQDLGLDIAVTELDVKEKDLAAPLAVRDQAVADEARRYLDVALAEPGVRGVTTWGICDRHSWLSQGDGAGGPALAGTAPQMNRGLPYDVGYTAKPLYYAMQGCLRTCGETGPAYRAPRSRIA